MISDLELSSRALASVLPTTLNFHSISGLEDIYLVLKWICVSWILMMLPINVLCIIYHCVCVHTCREVIHIWTLKATLKHNLHIKPGKLLSCHMILELQGSFCFWNVLDLLCCWYLKNHVFVLKSSLSFWFWFWSVEKQR